jgi:hypothetical protein
MSLSFKKTQLHVAAKNQMSVMKQEELETRDFDIGVPEFFEKKVFKT